MFKKHDIFKYHYFSCLKNMIYLNITILKYDNYLIMLENNKIK